MFISLLKYLSIFFLITFVASCLPPNDPEVLGDKVAYPGKIIAVDDQHFLLLNTDAATVYRVGSIHRYRVNDDTDPQLEHVFSVPSHGSDIALTKDNKLLALGFDGSKPNTQLFFYDYSNPDAPNQINDLTLNFAAGGGKQTIKQLNFFEIETPDKQFENDYFLYGVILNSKLDTGKGDNIPTRTFLARVSKDLSSSEVLFVLSYGVGDEYLTQTLTQKSDSLKPTFTENEVQYMIGSSAPVFDPKHNYFIAFPTGSMNGYNDTRINEFPRLPLDINQAGSRESSALKYFAGQKEGNVNCKADEKCIQPDLRAVSVFVVDLIDFLNNHPNDLNASLYFTPLAWNVNGVPYNHNTKGAPLIYGGNSADVASFTFQYNFWSSFLNSDGSILLAKQGTNGEDDPGNGNEVFRVSGLDTLSEYIEKTKELFPISKDSVKDFKTIASRQIFDAYHPLSDVLEKRITPLIPYIYAKTTDEANFVKAPTAVYGFDIVCTNPENEASCAPYWVRSSYLGLGAQGRDSSWLTVTLPEQNYQADPYSEYPDAVRDPTKFNVHDFPSISGAYVCATIARKNIYCASFLTGNFSKLQLTSKGFSGTIPKKLNSDN